MSSFTERHADRPDAARLVLEKKLDRRFNYKILNGQLCCLCEWTDKCSGCIDHDGSNFGCDECGYTGKRRIGVWIPAEIFFSEEIMSK